MDCHGWDIDTVQWRSYWVDTVYPGISKWTLPELHGNTVPQDPPMARPITLAPQPVVRAAKAVS